jgi:hypothetical protein
MNCKEARLFSHIEKRFFDCKIRRYLSAACKAFCSIPTRHDASRRVEAFFLGRQVAEQMGCSALSEGIRDGR